MAVDILGSFVSKLKNKDGGIVTTAKELKENQFGIPLKHYALQYLFGATGLRLQVFNSIQGQKEAGKSTLLFDLMGQICADEEHGGERGIGVLYELEGKISPSVMWSILDYYGERAVDGILIQHGMSLEEAMRDMNTNIVPKYTEACKDFRQPLVIGIDSIGGASAEDTIDKLKKEGVAGKGYWEKQHIMKYFCENQGTIFSRLGIPVVVICINQEREAAAAQPFMPPKKTITGGKAQLFKDGHMISASKKALASGDGNVLYLKTTKTSFCDPRSIEVQFRWNRYGKKKDDAYEARFLWGLAAAKCLSDPDKGVGDIRDICNVKLSSQNLVTCPQLGMKDAPPGEFETALMADEKLLDQLYTYQKIERLRDMKEYSEFMTSKPKAEEPEEKQAKPKPKAKAKAKEEKPAPASTVNLMDEVDK